jgi:hypothetical protein
MPYEKDLFRPGRNLANFFLYTQKCVEAVGEVRSHDWVWTKIAKRLGVAELYNPRLADVPDEKWDEAMEICTGRLGMGAEGYRLSDLGWEGSERPVFRYEIRIPVFKKT